MTGLDRLRERIAGLRALKAVAESDGAAIFLAALEEAEALVAPDYEADDDDADEQPEDDAPAPREFVAPPPEQTLRDAPLPPHLRELRGYVVATPPLRAEAPQMPVWTEQRDAELIQRRAAGEDWPTIHAALMAMPGGPISSPEACSQRIYRLRASGDPRAIPLRPQGIAEEEWAEAIEMRRKQSGGRAICEWFGWDLRRAGTICAALDRAIAEERAA